GYGTRLAYDARGNLSGKIDALDRKTEYRYDALKRLTYVRLPSGASIRCAYDGEGNLVRYVDENGAETQLEYFGQGEIARKILPDGHCLRYHYNTEEQLTAVTNQRGETYQLKRDALGRIVEETDYWGQSRLYTLSPAGNIRAILDPCGRKIRYTTDPLGRILSRALPDPFSDRNEVQETFDYDAAGNLIAMEGPHARIDRRYDLEGRLLEEKQGEHFTIRNRYDEVGNRISRHTLLTFGTSTTEHEVRYAYDDFDRASEIGIDGQAPIKLTRNAAGQIISERLTAGLHRELEYSIDGQLSRRRVRAGLSDVLDTRYAYDLAGNLTERRDAQFGVDRFLYDPMGRVIQHIDPMGTLRQYLNDPAGDLLHTHVRQKPAPSGALNGADVDWSREGALEGSFYRFDRSGNLVERRDGRGELSLSWDAAQRLVESRLGDVSTLYGYDCLGRRL
ncbi:MAG TPA: hypothetical protein VFO36_04960, partial [Nitrospiraceae bacterium]|nr:hypothetical protein [Nitrospiraceae bacterium]